MKKRKYTAKLLCSFLMLVQMIALTACDIHYLAYEPQETVKEFFHGIETKDEDILVKYIENDTINLLLNTKGSEKQKDRLYDSLFQNLSYKIVSVKTDEEKVKSTIEVEVTNHNFNKVFSRYADAAYDYLDSNLYNNHFTKKELNRKCFKMFVDEAEKIAKNGKDVTKTIAIELESNGNYGWKMILSDELAKAITGNLSIPVL